MDSLLGATDHTAASLSAGVEQLPVPVPIYTPEFAADPHGYYRVMREQFGSLVPVEIWPGVPATLVISYRTAVQICNDPQHFRSDPRVWQRTVDNSIPIMPMVEWRPNALRSDGGTVDHQRYRSATNDALGGVDQLTLHNVVEKIAVPAINEFCENGHADLLSQYIAPVAFAILNDIIGCPPEIGERVAAASAALFEGVDTATVNEMLDSALLELTQLKRLQPGDDIATRLINHPAGLSDQEMVHQLVTLYSAGHELPQDLIARTLVLMLTDSRFVASKNNGSPLPTKTALMECLTTDPPLANYLITYPAQPKEVDGVWLAANQPVMISMAACSSDPAVATGDYTLNSSHLGWGTGPHSCPVHAQSLSMMIAQDVIDQFLDALPDARPAVPVNELVWRPGPFHRALASFPITFPPTPPLPVM
ncbi:cytochrome P450 [Nocardia vermiculata]|uniref:cytochrome P450 n=1 Tax=Nocardia vermiculata TaxID=257274 RepID=UPI000A88ECA7|nr:cytochrome P450 [Nocardia vermiculata]